MTDSRATTTRPLTCLVLAAGAWLLVGWSILDYGDATRAVSVDVLAGLVLISLATLQLVDGPTHRLSVLMVWTGPRGCPGTPGPAVRIREAGRSCFANDLIVGVVVMGSGALLARRTPRLP